MCTSTKTILLVDDDAILALHTARQLHQQGYQVATAYNGRAAIDYVAAGRPVDLILMDINMPGMDGTEAAQRILEDHTLPLLFLSSHTERDVVEKTEAITSYGYVVKGSGETVLYTSIKMAFRLFEAHQSLQQALAEQERINCSLQQREQDLQNIFSVIPDLFFRLTVGGVFLDFMGGRLENLLLPPEMFIGKSMADVLPAEVAQRLQAGLQAALTTGQPVEVQYDLPMPNGPQSYEALLLPTAVEEIVALVRNVTERDRAARQAYLGEIRYRLLFLQSPVGILQYDLQGVVLDCNPALATLLGASREAILGQRLFEYLRDPQVIAAIQQSLESGLGVYEGPYCSVAGAREIYLRARYLGMPAPGGGYEMGVGLLEDITEQYRTEQALSQSEARFRTAFHANPAAMSLSTLDGCFLDVNVEFERVTGWQRDEALGRTSVELDLWLNPQERPRLRSRIEQEGVVRNYELMLRTRSGQLRHLLWSGERLMIGDQTCILASAQDITERKVMEQLLRQQQLLYEHVFSEQSAMLLSWAKNTLSLIDSMAGLVGGGSGLGMGSVRSRIKTMADLSGLLYAGDGAHEMALDLYCTQVTASLQQTRTLDLQQTYEPMTVPGRLAIPVGLILAELLDNARQHAFPGGRSGRVSVWLRPISGGAVLGVADDGVGLPPGFDLARSEKMGLMMVQALVLQIGGRLRQSGPPGLRWEVEFPLGGAPAGMFPAASPGRPAPG